jgi:23S rRNA (uracil1939-C5)-methyltransferase
LQLSQHVSQWTNLPAQIHQFGEWSLRDRVDLTLDSANGQTRLGLYGKAVGSRELVDLTGCPQLSTPLENWLREFRRDLPPLNGRGSLRLRVSPTGLRGVWLDFANADIKLILDEAAWLDRLAAQGVVIEMGQRRKRAQRDETRWRLIDPQPEAWFETWMSTPATILDSKVTDTHVVAQPLYGKIASFTQPSRQANRELIRLALQHLCSTDTALELGSGIGNFTLPIAARAEHVFAWENDKSALDDLRVNLENSGLTHKVQVQAVDFIRGYSLESSATDSASKPSANFVLVDPPRAGLGRFASDLAELEAERLAYISCYPESWAQDLETLSRGGWQLKELHIVDQFPRTRHYEIVSHLSRD